MLLTSISASADRMSNTFGPEILITATPDFPKTVDKAYIVEADILTILYFLLTLGIKNISAIKICIIYKNFTPASYNEY